MSGDDDDDDDLSPLVESTGDARRVAMARAAGPLPNTRTSHASLDEGVNNDSDEEVLCFLREMEDREENAFVVVVVEAVVVDEVVAVEAETGTTPLDVGTTKALADGRDTATATTAVKRAVIFVNNINITVVLFADEVSCCLCYPPPLP